MDPTALVWMASIAGAALFAAGGFWLARARVGQGDDGARVALDELSARLAEAGDEQNTLRTALADLDAERARVVGEKDAALAEARRALASAERAAAVEARQQAERAAGELRRVAQQVDDERRQAQLALRALEEARTVQAREAEQAAALRHDLAVAAQMHDNQKRVAEALRTENDSLRAETRTLCAELTESRAAADTLSRQLAAARGSDESVQVPEATAASHPAVPGTVGGMLQSLVDRMGDGVEAAVVADQLGLVVASRGEHGDALAAVGAFLAHAGARARDVLPLRDLRAVIIQDASRRTVTVRPVASPHAELMLVTLGPGTRRAHGGKGAE